MKLHVWSYFTLALFAMNMNACRQQQYAVGESTSEAIRSNLPYEIYEIRKTSGDCQAPESPCVILSVMYPRVSSGSEAAQDKINNYITGVVAEKMQQYSGEKQTDTNNLDSLGDVFISRFNQTLTDFPDYKHRWSYNLEGSIAFDSLNIITIEFNLFSYTGGAHPNAQVIYNSFDDESGKRLALAEVVTDVDKLKELAEKKFRQQKKLGQHANLNEAGYMFENNQFTLNDNFGILKEGIIFYYNDYEIAPYAMGPTEILISYEEVGDLLKL